MGTLCACSVLTGVVQGRAALDNSHVHFAVQGLRQGDAAIATTNDDDAGGGVRRGAALSIRNKCRGLWGRGRSADVKRETRPATKH
jgi:hypothetical protein